MEVDKKIISILSKSPLIYFAGRNNGVAEEATLKTNEITSQNSLLISKKYLERY